jgi:hypothetical protein
VPREDELVDVVRVVIEDEERITQAVCPLPFEIRDIKSIFGSIISCFSASSSGSFATAGRSCTKAFGTRNAGQPSAKT